jgi:hypothetical protein
MLPFISFQGTENIFTGTRTQDSFGIVAFVPVISLLKQTTLVLVLSFYRAQFPSYRNQFHQESNPGLMFVAMAFVPVISSPKQTYLSFASLFYRA